MRTGADSLQDHLTPEFLALDFGQSRAAGRLYAGTMMENPAAAAIEIIKDEHRSIANDHRIRIAP